MRPTVFGCLLDVLYTLICIFYLVQNNDIMRPWNLCRRRLHKFFIRIHAYIQAEIPVYTAKRLYPLRGQRQQNASVLLADVRCGSPAEGDDRSSRTLCRPERAVYGANEQATDTDRRTVAGRGKETARIHSKMLEQTSRCLAEQAGGVVDRLDGGNAQPPCGKRQHLRRGGRWKGAYQQAKSDRTPCHAGCRAENSDSTTEKTTCGV